MPCLAPRLVFHPRGVDPASADRFGWIPVARIGRKVYIEKLNGLTIPQPGCPHVPLTLREQAETLVAKLDDICERTGLEPRDLGRITVRVRPGQGLSALSAAYRVLYDFFGEKIDEAEWLLERFPGPRNELIRFDAVAEAPAEEFAFTAAERGDFAPVSNVLQVDFSGSVGFRNAA